MSNAPIGLDLNPAAIIPNASVPAPALISTPAMAITDAPDETLWNELATMFESGVQFLSW